MYNIGVEVVNLDYHCDDLSTLFTKNESLLY